jgi:excisionase family DNA binding protein
MRAHRGFTADTAPYISAARKTLPSRVRIRPSSKTPAVDDHEGRAMPRIVAGSHIWRNVQLDTLLVEEICGHLGVSRDTTYRWIADRRMPAHRIGRLWKFKLSEVDGWARTKLEQE